MQKQFQRGGSDKDDKDTPRTYQEALNHLGKLRIVIKGGDQSWYAPPLQRTGDSSGEESDDEVITPPSTSPTIGFRHMSGVVPSTGDVHIVHDECPEELTTLFTQMSLSLQPGDPRRFA